MAAIRHDDLLLRLVKEVNDIKAALRRVVVNLPLYDIANENTPAQLTADQDNYPPGNYDVLRLSSSTSVNISGMRGGVKGRSLILFNDGNYPITLLHGSLLSDAANRFRFSSGYNAVIPPQANTNVYYDSSNSRWIDADRSSSGVVFVRLSRVPSLIRNPAPTKVSNFTVLEDYYGFYDAVTSKVITKFSGTYISIQKMECAADYPNVSAPIIYVYKNGAVERSLRTSAATDSNDWPTVITLSTIFTVNQGDELEFYVSDDNVNKNTDNFYWEIARLG